jgi:aminoglycoside 6'-N-acetyltransferase I
MSLNVRPVDRHDRDAWLRMRMALWPEESGADLADEVDAFLRDPESSARFLSAVFVCEETPGRPAGFIEIFVRNYAEGCSGDTPHVEGWYVHPESRGRGVGRALMGAAETWARAHGFSELGSDTLLGNESSQGAHRKLGFEEIERTVHFRKPL